jgi:hypothetical protein
MNRILLVVLLSLLTASAFAAPAATPAAPADKSLLVIATYIGGAEFFEMPIIKVLLKEGWHIQRADITEVKEPLLKQFQVVLLTDATRLDPSATKFDSLAATQPMIEASARSSPPTSRAAATSGSSPAPRTTWAAPTRSTP